MAANFSLFAPRLLAFCDPGSFSYLLHLFVSAYPFRLHVVPGLDLQESSLGLVQVKVS